MKIRRTARSSITRSPRRCNASSYRSVDPRGTARGAAFCERRCGWPSPIPGISDKPAYWERPFVRPSTGAGMHRFVWDLRDPAPRSLQQVMVLPISAVVHDTPRVPEGPLVVPGRYTVRLEVDGRVLERPLRVAMDPRVSISQGQLERQYLLAHQIAAILDRSYDEATAAKRAGRAQAAAAFEAINNAAAQLLDERSMAPTLRRRVRPSMGYKRSRGENPPSRNARSRKELRNEIS